MKKNIIIVLLIVLLGFSSCSQNTEKLELEDPEKINETTETSNSVDLEEDLMKLFPSGEKVKYEEKGQPLLEQLLADEAAGKITRNERALYTLMLAYNKESALPKAYQGYEGWVDPHYEMRYITAEWDSFSKEMKEKISPYILPINNPKSIYYPDSQENESSIIPVAYAASDQLIERSFKYDNQQIEIAYVLQNDWMKTSDLVALMNALDLAVEEAIRHGWKKFKPIMQKTPSSKIRVELISMKRGLGGLEWHDGTQYRIRINTLYAYNVKKVQSTLVHELFHAFQDEYDIGYDKKDEKWLCEATAVWSENCAYPAYNFEHSRLEGFFKTLSKNRIDFGNLYEYQSYMLFFYLTEYAKINIIRDVIAEAGASGSSAIRPFLNNNIPNRRETYGEFALFNWNQGNFIKYQDSGFLNGSPSGDALEYWMIYNEDENKQTVSLNPGAIKYYHYVFDRSDKDLHHVYINFSDKFVNDSDISRQVLLKINGQWSYETWNDETNKRYCNVRNDDELVEELVLIYSNGSFTEAKRDLDHFKLWTEGCHEAMTLDINATYEYSVEDFNWSAKINLQDELLIEDHYLFLIKESNYSLSGSGLFEGTSSIKTTGQIGGSVQEPTIENTIARIILPMGKEHEETLETYKAFGIDEITPEGGVLITLPFAMTDRHVSGNTTIELPEPIGTVDIDEPFPIDGISQAIAIKIKPSEWGPNGLSLTREIDLFAHKPAILNIYELNSSNMKETLEKMQEDFSGSGINMNISQEELNEINELLEDMPDVEGMNIPGIEGSNTMGGTMNAFSTLINAMTFDGSNVDGNAKLTIEVKGRYTK